MKKLVAVVLMLPVLAALAAPPAQAGRDKDELVIGITQFPASFHPNIDSMMAKTYVLAMTRRPFTAYDAEWKLVCMLCVTLPTIDNGLAVAERGPTGRKGIAVTYAIRPEATWGDGVPISTEDVIFTWKVGRHPLSGVSDMEFYRSLYRIDVKDEKTFTMHFDKLTFEYNAINNFNLLPAHLDESAFAEPKEYKNRTAYDADTVNEGLYFGPYLIAKVESGSHIVLETNPKWWGEKPRFKRIIVRVIGNTAALEANILSGGIDMIAGELGLTVDQALAFEKRHGRSFNIVYKPGLIYEHIDFNLNNPILKDIRVRQALIHSIDRETVNKQLFAGRLATAHSPVNPLDWVYDDNVRRYPFDPDLAGRLLSEAGWKAASQGPRRNAKGETLTLEIMTTAGNRTREMVEQVLQNQWKAQGVDVRINNQPARVFFGQTVTERRYSAMAMYAWISAPESVPRTTLHSAHIPGAANNYAGQNYTGFANEEMDMLIDRIEVELDRPKRKEMWRRLQEIYAAELPVIPLFFLAEPYILPPWLKGLVPTGHQDPSTLWVENWRRE